MLFICVSFLLYSDECSDPRLHNCSGDQMCQNTMGGFRCSCREGFEFGSDGVTCERKLMLNDNYLLLQ